ncbi:MAG: hypothetical protein FWF80_02995 [Defluviitaleaceae bacterium]|nr:hypothetical protein [Defluviitaleaceae bacterium]
MTFVKRVLCAFLLAALLVVYIPPLEVEAVSDVPVWRVAWVVIGGTRVQYGNNVAIYTVEESGMKDTFIEAASEFKDFIETHTNNAVDVQISIIEVNEIIELRSRHTDRVSLYPRLSSELKERYGLYDYDTWTVGWPFYVNWSPYHGTRQGGAAYGIRETYVKLSPNSATLSTNSARWPELMLWLTIHEFLHTTERWFRDSLRFPLPYDIGTGDRHLTSALHHGEYFGFDIFASSLEAWYPAWFSQTVPNPRYPINRLPQYLGIPPEAWHHTPSRISVTVNPNNGNEPIVDVGQTGRTIERPPNPEPTAATGDSEFMGWYRNPDFTHRAWFPHRVVGNVSFYARWGTRGALTVPSDNSEAYICLDAERLVLPPGFNRAAHSINGGRTWQVGARHGITQQRFTSMLNRGLHLVITNSWDSARRRPADGATTITFEPIQARARRNPQRLRAFYHDDTWSLMTRVTNREPAPFFPEGTYDFVHSTTNQLPVSPEWHNADVSFDMQPRRPRGDRTRNVFFFRTAPHVNQSENIFIPASRPFRITPAPFRNATNHRINYTTEAIRLRRGQEYSNDGGTTWTPTLLDGTRAIPLDVSHYITSSTALMIRTATTGRRPSSEIQTITPQQRASLATTLPMELPVVNGRICAQALRPYRAWINNRWRAVPRNNAGPHQIRLHPTARLRGGVWEGDAASEVGTLHVTMDGNRVTSAWITAAGQSPPTPTPSMYALPPDSPEITTEAALWIDGDF